jgi:HlyD family secretion protein
MGQATVTSIAAGGMDRARPRRKSRRLIYGAAGAAATAIIGAALWWRSPSVGYALRLDAAKITEAAVTRAPFHDFIPVRGQLLPLESVALDAVQGGQVEAVLAEAGQRVTAGQPILKLSNTSVELEVIAREAQVIEQINNQNAIELQFEQTRTGDSKSVLDAEYNIIRLKRQVERRGALATKGYTSQEALDQAADELAYQQRLHQVALEGQKRDLATIERNSRLFEETSARLSANLTASRKLLDALVVRAPVDGVLTALDAHPGENKTQGQHLGQVDQEGGYKLSVQLDEFYLSRVAQGQKVEATVAGQSVRLTVAKIYPQVNAGRFAIDLSFDTSAPKNLRRGQAIEGRLELGGSDESIVMPAGPFLEHTGGAWVFVIDQAGTTAARRSIKLGRRTPESVEVLAGLAPGERVLISDYTGFDRVERIDISR